MKILIAHLYISEGHNFFGRHGLDPLAHGMVEVERFSCVAGRGVEGDRFFDYKKDYKGQITFFADEVYQLLCRDLGVNGRTPDVLRRNVISEGVDLNALIGEEFEIQGIRFLGTGECSPCYWMNQAFAPGAEAFLKGRGGLRAKILSSGTLSVSRAAVEK